MGNKQNQKSSFIADIRVGDLSLSDYIQDSLKVLSPVAYQRIPVLALGDSITAQNTGNSSGSVSRYPNGYMTALQYYSKERYDWRHAFNFGVSGDTTAQIVARLNAVQTAVRTYGIKTAIFMAGTNDVEALVSSSTTNTNYITILDYLIDTCGLDVFALGAIPRLGFVGNPTKIKLNRTNDANLAARCAERQRCVYVPLYDIMGGGTDTPLPDYLHDGTHPSQLGAFKGIGKRLYLYMKPYYGDGSWDYGERNYLDGEVLNNLTAGTNGTTLTTITGNIPTGWYLFAPSRSGTTVTFEKQPNGAMRISMSSTGNGTIDGFAMFKNIASGSYNLKDYLQAQVDIDVIECTNVRSVGCRMVDDATPDLTHDGANAAYFGVTANYPVTGRGFVSSNPMQLSSNNTAVNCQIFAILDNQTAPASITFDVYRVKIRKFIPYKQVQVDAAGTAYTLTTAPAAVTFGTTSPATTLNEAGSWKLEYDCIIKYVGATFAAQQDITVKLRRTNNTAADITGSNRVVTTDVVTTKTATMVSVSGSAIYDTDNINDAVSLFASVAALPSAGSVQITSANIRVYKIPPQNP